MDKGHGDRSLQPWCPTAIPEARAGHGCRAALALHGLGQAHDREASRWSSPIPVVPGLGAAPAPWQPPVPPPGVQPWDGRGLLCRGLCPALGQGTPQGSTSAGREVTPAVPTPPRSHNTPGPPRTLHGPSSASFHPPIGSSGGARPTPKPRDTPALPGPLRGKPPVCAFGFALLAFRVPVQTSPAALTPGRCCRWDQHFCTLVLPKECSDGIGMDSNKLQA